MSKFFTLLCPLLLALAQSALPLEAVKSSPLALPEPEKSGPAPTGSGGLPMGLNGTRFAPLAKKSPFTLASTTEETADFAKDLTLGGYFRMDGQDYVMVANRTRPDRVMVGSQASAAAQGMVLIKVERDPSGDPTKLKAQIRKGTETATLKYEAVGAAPAASPVPGQPVQAPNPGQPPIPGQPIAGQPALAPGGQKAAPNPTVIRRRQIPLPTLPGPAR